MRLILTLFLPFSASAGTVELTTQKLDKWSGWVMQVDELRSPPFGPHPVMPTPYPTPTPTLRTAGEGGESGPVFVGPSILPCGLDADGQIVGSLLEGFEKLTQPQKNPDPLPKGPKVKEGDDGSSVVMASTNEVLVPLVDGWGQERCLGTKGPLAQFPGMEEPPGDRKELLNYYISRFGLTFNFSKTATSGVGGIIVYKKRPSVEMAYYMTADDQIDFKAAAVMARLIKMKKELQSDIDSIGLTAPAPTVVSAAKLSYGGMQKSLDRQIKLLEYLFPNASLWMMNGVGP